MYLAHDGGLPETATILVPLLVVAAFVVQERRNVRRIREREAAEAEQSEQAAPDADAS